MNLLVRVPARAFWVRALPILAMIALLVSGSQNVRADQWDRQKRVIKVPYSIVATPPIPRTGERDVDGYQLLLDSSLLSTDNVDPTISDEDLAEIVDALVRGDTREAVDGFLEAQFTDFLQGLGAGGNTPHGNIMELVFLIMKEAVQEQNEDKAFWAAKLEQYRRIAEAIADYLESLQDQQRSCGLADSHCSRELIQEIGAAIDETEGELSRVEREVELAVLDLDDVLEDDDPTLRFLEDNVLAFYEPMLAIVEGDPKAPIKLILPDHRNDDDGDDDRND